MESWLGVRYPDAVRYDLAVLEILFLPVVLFLFHLLPRYKPIPGFYAGTFLEFSATGCSPSIGGLRCCRSSPPP